MDIVIVFAVALLVIFVVVPSLIREPTIDIRCERHQWTYENRENVAFMVCKVCGLRPNNEK